MFVDLGQGVLQIGTAIVRFYVLRDARGVTIIDGGFVGDRRRLRRALGAVGWHRDPVVAILVTHGHLDHMLHVCRLAEETGAPIYAPRLDEPRYRGRGAFRGPGAVAGAMEWVGRPLLGFRGFTPDVLLDDGDEIDLWRGLRTVRLPGHTEGHSGFFCEDNGWLFSGDLVRSGRGRCCVPPLIFNARPRDIPKSVAKACELMPTAVLPNHCDRSSPTEHRNRLLRLSRCLKNKHGADAG